MVEITVALLDLRAVFFYSAKKDSVFSHQWMQRRYKMAKRNQEKATARTTKTAAKKKTTKKAATTKTVTTPVGIKKEYMKGKNVCKVTFRLPSIAAPDAKTVSIVGDFNDWNIYANPMKKMKNKDFAITLELQPGSEYQFRYLIDENSWENDWNADKYVKSPYGTDNSVIVV